MHMALLCSWVSLLAGSPHWEQLHRLVLEGHHVQEGRCTQVVWDGFSHEVVYVVWCFWGNYSLTWPQTFGDSSTPASRVLDLGRHEVSCLVQRFYLSFWKQLALVWGQSSSNFLMHWDLSCLRTPSFAVLKEHGHELLVPFMVDNLSCSFWAKLFLINGLPP